MSTPKRQSTRETIRAVERERSRILQELLAVRTMLPGSYTQVLTKCGRDNCWCTEGSGHPHSRITWRDAGKQTTRKVPQDQVDSVVRLTGVHRQFRALRRDLRNVQAKIKRLLDAHQQEVIIHTSRNKPFLSSARPNRKSGGGIPPKNSTHGKTRMP